MRAVGIAALCVSVLLTRTEKAQGQSREGRSSTEASEDSGARRSKTSATEASRGAVENEQRVVEPPRFVRSDEQRPLPECDAGAVLVSLTIDAQGRVTTAELVPGDVAAADAARDWALGATFEPAKRGGRAMASKIDFAVPCETRQTALNVESSGEVASVTSVEVANAEEPANQTPSNAIDAIGGEPEDIEVEVLGESTAERLRRSASAVSILELTSARQRTGTLGEVLSRQEGASVRTMGGLGGFTRFSLDGLSNEQVRFFIDDVPLRFAGYSMGVANVPVDQLDHVEVHHGVVPARFGADALGGAVNLSTLEVADGSVLGGAVSTGSFGTTRLTASVTHKDTSSHLLVRANAFRDRADNDFMVYDVPVVDSRGQLSRASRPHFHNHYAADGVGLELGAINVPWARYLVVRGFHSTHEKEIPHDDIGVRNQNPYGEVTYGRTASGILVKHQWGSDSWRIDSRFGFTNERLRYVDVSRCSYDWFGRCAVERRSRGEVSDAAVDARISDQFWFARLNGSWLVAPTHELRLSFAPTLSTRQGKNDVILAEVPDALDAKRRYVTSVLGAEYEARGAEGGWVNNLFGKWYTRSLYANEVLPNGNPRQWDQLVTYGGVGDGLRVDLTNAWYAKASYEYAIRFPSLEEIFGDGAQVVDNLELESERSHNANLELHGSTGASSGSEATFSLRSFARFLRDRIWLQALSGYSEYTNIDHSRVLGVEGVVSWMAPGRWLFLSANGTWLHSRETSGGEPVRLPSDPWFWANAQATLTKGALFIPADSVSLDWNVNYIHGFPLSVGQRGDPASRLRVDAQTVHTAALRYVMAGDSGILSAAAEVNNVLDARVTDFYGIQRPGRAFFLKVSVQVSKLNEER